MVGHWLEVLGEFVLFGLEVLKSVHRLWRRRGLFLKQCEFIGVSSLGITAVAAIFMGAVLGFQLYISLHIFGGEALLGGTIGASLFRELAPVMAAIMVTGRAGAAMAAEIASMRITEQVDALDVMAVSPIEYLVLPRIMAGWLMMPLLSLFFAGIGTAAAGAVAIGLMGLDAPVYWDQFALIVDGVDLIQCMIKGAIFGLILTWMGCFCGYRASGGASAVGYATRTTVVATFLVILFSDYLITSLMPFGFSTLKAT